MVVLLIIKVIPLQIIVIIILRCIMVQPLLDLVLGNTMHGDEVVFYAPWVHLLVLALLAKRVHCLRNSRDYTHKITRSTILLA